jgi:natural product biosynthesis luciferase-like monooxygenase protein
MEHSYNQKWYRLSPMQEGMLFHHLYARNAGVDIEQLVCSLHEAVQIEALSYAWRKIVERYDVLRTSFQWENPPQPLQTVHERVSLPFEVSDLRGLSAAIQEQQLDRYLENDRSTGFEWDCPPLMRLALFRLADDQYKLVWSFHHAIVDGRSFPIVLNEVFSIYDAQRQNKELHLPPVRPYADYIRWLDTLDLSKAEEFWRGTLKNFTCATPLSTLENPGDEYGCGQEENRLSEQATESLQALSKREAFTLNTIVQGAWALVLSRYSASKDVVFGATRACRAFSKDAASMVGTFINTLPVRVQVSGEMLLFPWLRQIRASQLAVREYEHTPLTAVQSWSEVPRGTSLFESIVVFENYLLNSKMRSLETDWTNREVHLIERTNYAITLYGYAERELLLRIAYDRARFGASSVRRMLEHLRTLLDAIAAGANARLADLPILTADERRQLLLSWNDTDSECPRERRIHDLIEDQVQRTPDRIAVIFNDQRMTYTELDRRADQLARYLSYLGVRPEDRVGICMRRSIDMMVALLAVLKAGGAYVPLDPSYPGERLKYILSDAQVAVVLTQENLRSSVSDYGARIVAVDGEWPAISSSKSKAPLPDFTSDNLAYVIYTSGSTGKPKGVMVTHRNVVNFFTGMDRKFGRDKPGVWLALTSISFDISVLELFWTLARGFRVVLQEENYDLSTSTAVKSAVSAKRIEFSLFYFASDENQSGDKYRLLMEGARFADQNGFTAIWTPERHFHAFGGLFPNPAITSAALAMITKNLQIRAGSVVLPLHNPIRVAEEWAMVDHFSQGRVGISCASGWHDRDFVFAPENYSDRKRVMISALETIRALWRGESITQRSGSGKEVSVRIFPRPIQPELPVWITSGGDPQTFRLAGETGANLLTHLLGQTLEELRTKIGIYRNSFSGRGEGAGNGHVTLMLHTFVGQRDDEAEDLVRVPFCNYLKSSVDLMKQVAKGMGEEFQNASLSEGDLVALIDHAFHRYFATSGLFGSPETCLVMIDKLKEIGVDEIACLIDFGIDSGTVLANLQNLRSLAAKSNEPMENGYSIPEQITRHRVTHMQCTPSFARMIINTSDAVSPLGSLEKLLIGGEALSPKLANDLHRAGPKEIWNMYGPTETTIWSTVEKLENVEKHISIGKPIANTSVFVLDENRQPVPIGVPGELYIGGEGVTRGYLNRPELTAEKFVRITFGEGDYLVYRTGDLVRYLPDGRLEFLGRLDHQVKIRGHRIELGEIETALCLHPGIQEAIVSAMDNGDEGKTLVAYMTKSNGALSPMEMRQFVESKLPSYMVPSSFVFLDAFPLTPNGKVDRNHLPKPEVVKSDQPIVAPRNATEATLADIWAEALRVQNVGIYDNFFELGGHSLSAVKVVAKIRAAFSVALPLHILLENPTVAELSVHLEKFIGSRAPSGTLVPLVAIQPRGSRPPFFGVHGGYGAVLFYSELARCLGEDQPFYGLQSEGLDGGPIRHTSIETIASYYIEEIRRVQAHGPYFLGGYCVGGIIAFEMARQLRAAGEPVECLTLFDVNNPERTPRHFSITKRIRLALDEAADLALIEKLQYFARRAADKMGWEGTQLQKVGYDFVELLYKALKPDAEKNNGSPFSLKVPVRIMLQRAESAYKPRAYPGRIILFRPTVADTYEYADDRGWAKFAEGGLEIHDVPGKHGAIFERQYAPVIAEKLDAYIRAALSGKAEWLSSMK